MSSEDDFLVQLIVERGLVGSAEIEKARRELESADLIERPRRLSDILIEQGHVRSEAILQLLGEEFSMPVVDLTRYRPHPSALDSLPKEIAQRYHVLPLELNASAVRVAVSDPLDTDTIDSISHILQRPVDPVLALRDDIDRAIERHYGGGGETVQSFLKELEPGTGDEPSEEEDTEKDVRILDEPEAESEADAPIIRLVQMIITEAFNRRASDIHLEPLEKRFRVRYRIDGVLHEVEGPPKRLQLAIISRIKIMSNMSIAEKRLPQDGRIQLMVGGRQIDLRVSCLPTAHGESIVMRILDKEGLMLGLPELGFLSDDQAMFERLISLPDGIILVTGPTGSGKTTTLYACLNYINRPDRKIITVEEPVEYQINGINQVPVRPDVGMTFAAALRAMLRQAPNVIMIGEIRDLETAEIAINASLTGHLVFSTLHTNDAPGAITRMIDLGIKPFLVSTALRAAMAQRLVRRVCSHCGTAYTPDRRELALLNLEPERVGNVQFRRGQGCPYCANTGYRGRMGVFEIFIVNDEIQRMIYESATAHALRSRAREIGMRTMRDDGVRKVLAGLTTPEEVVSVTVGDLS
ncbi:MAG: type II secretion system protein GspE [Verrucomicrobia bacterium]|nr:MAG: type II secretion system protein GspE [Verrucomicrobiota bacterium]